MPTTIKKGHVESLSKHTIPVPRVEEYRRLKWTIVETDTPIILGDVGCIFKVDGEDSFKPTCEVDKVSQIYLPISSYKILVGTNGVEIELDIGVLKEAIAKCSYEQFICSERADDKIALRNKIGSNSQLVDDEEIDQELNEIRRNVQRVTNDDK